ncbi:DUF1176 domain-containing protein [Rhizobium alvei]|uniref:DUF1176 domain-containing protein n=1 Tax=Rhizobium alvei TaxID=1132659 RepID=A0ABT8YHU8_9HYPH|nr:DUF1176 domain-containing protein [Rhizobium alvei]MDO6963164.1 DUF1176 domain-containing protein [Rhizobium alvei]
MLRIPSGLLASSLLLLSVSTVLAEETKTGVFHPGASVSARLGSAPEDEEDACFSGCASLTGCKAYVIDNGTCHFYAAIEEGTEGAGAYLLHSFDPELERQNALAELSSRLHADYLRRAERLRKEAPSLFDGSFADSSGSLFKALDQQNYDHAIELTGALAATASDSQSQRTLSERLLVAALNPEFRGRPETRQRLIDQSVSTAVLAVLQSVDEVDRREALMVLARALAGAGDVSTAVAVGERAIELGAGGAFATSVAGWKEQKAPRRLAPGIAIADSGDDSQLSCDNAGDCILTLFSGEGDPVPILARLEIRRDAGPAASTEAKLVVATFEEVERFFPNHGEVPKGMVRLDGAGQDFFAGLIFYSQADGDEMRLSIPTERLGDFLAAVAKSKALEIIAEGKVLARIPLGQAQQLMARMDSLQGVAGSPLALVAPGRDKAQAPLPALLPDLALPEFSAQAIKGKVPAPVAEKWLAACEGDGELTADRQPDRHAEGWDLGEGRSFWLIQCSSGAYQESYFPFLLSAEGVTDLKAEMLDGEGRPSPSDMELTMPQVRFAKTVTADLASENEEQETKFEGMLTVATWDRGRGPGDCGSHALYGFDGNGLKLISQERMQLCRGQRPDWPTVWRANAHAGEATIPPTANADPSSSDVPPDQSSGKTAWRLSDVTFPIGFRECLENQAGEEEPMRACIRDEHASWDLRLNEAYKHLRQQFMSGETGVVTKDAAEKLKAAQKAWIKMRDATCAAEADMYEGAMPFYWRDFCLLRETAYRTDFLESMIEGGDK